MGIHCEAVHIQQYTTGLCKLCAQEIAAMVVSGQYHGQFCFSTVAAAIPLGLQTEPED